MRIGTGSSGPRVSKAVSSGAFSTKPRAATPFISQAAAPVRSYPSPSPRVDKPSAKTSYVQRSAQNVAPRRAPVVSRPTPKPVARPTPKPAAPKPVAPKPAAPAPKPNLTTRNGTVSEVARRLAQAKAAQAAQATEPINVDPAGKIAQNSGFLGGSVQHPVVTPPAEPLAQGMTPVETAPELLPPPGFGNYDPGTGLAPASAPTPGTSPGMGADPATPVIDPTGAEPISAPAPPPSEEDWLQGDTTYQDQQAQLRRDFAAYQASQQLDQSNYDQTYQGQLRDLTQHQQQDLTGLNDDFASRGLTNSGLYAQAQADLENRYNGQRTGLESSKQQYLSQLQQQLADYQNQQNTTAITGKQDSIARRAAQFNLGG